MRRWQKWLAAHRIGVWFVSLLVAGLAALALTVEQTRPHLDGELLRYDSFVGHVEGGRIVSARILNYDSYVVGTYRRRDGVEARYRTAYFKTYGGAGGSGLQNDLLTLLTINRVPVQIDQQVGKSIAGVLTAVIPALMAIVALLYLIVSWRRGTGLFATGGSPRRTDPDAPSVTFDDVAGQDAAVTELREIADYLAEPERFAAVGSTIPRGVLLYGPPGLGQDAAGARARGRGRRHVLLRVGRGVRRAVRRRRRVARPEPVRGGARQRAGDRLHRRDRRDRAATRGRARRAQGGDEQEQALNQILTEMDGFAGPEGVIVLAATNRPDVLDPALLRPGRFDRSVGLERTDEAGRLEILRLHARGRPLAADADLEGLARRAVG